MAYRISIVIPIFLLFALNPACLKKNPQQPGPANSSITAPPGMRVISASGASFYEGTSDSSRPLDQRPAMPVKFSYDFALDTTEVTQNAYDSMTGRNPVPAQCRYGVGRDYPVYNVTWFDAALYCNAMSKKRGYDTVYSYAQVLADSSTGSVYNLIGLRINYAVAGYRLPTEAEWEFAATGGGSETPVDSSTAWYAANAQGSTHVAGSKPPNALGLYDMAGNVFEWTDDWKCPHCSVSIVNPIGGESANKEFERVVKGGAFISGAKDVRPQNRATNYPTAASSSTYYIGFRCAFGPIGQTRYVSNDTSSARTNPVSLTLSNIADYAPSSDVRLVFVNITGSVRTLCYVNYAESRPQIREFKDRSDVYTPTISPDGRFVAFATAGEGMRDVVESSLFVRSLDSIDSHIVALPAPDGFVPRWWVDPSTRDTFIVYTNSGIDCALADWSSTRTYKQKMSNGRPMGDPIVLVADGSFHDGVSQDGKYIVTGQSQLKMKNLVTGETRQLFVSPANGKPANGSTQVCNVSISPDSTYADVCMFLDFGSGQNVSTITKTSYAMHEYLFFFNFSNQERKYLKCPSGENSWEYPEWSNRLNYAISAAEDQNGNMKNLYLLYIDIGQNDRICKVVAGENLAYPYLWVAGRKPSRFDDSAGRYDEPPKEGSQENYYWKMAGFWKYRDSMEIVFVGTSHTQDDIVPDLFSKKAVNFGVPGTITNEHLSIINDYVVPHCKKVRLVGMDIATGWFFLPTPDSSKTSFFLNNGFKFDKNNNFWRDSVPAEFLSAIDNLPVFKKGDIWAALTEAVQNQCMGWGGANPVHYFNVPPVDSAEFRRNWGDLVKTADTLKNRGVHFLVMITPESPFFASTPFYSMYGPDWETGRMIVSKLRDLEKANPFFHLYDAYLEGKHDYSDTEAMDQDHLCTAGANKFSKRVDSLVTVILENK